MHVEYKQIFTHIINTESTEAVPNNTETLTSDIKDRPDLH